MAITHVKGEFQFPPEFGFTGSARRTDNARNHAMDPSGEEDESTYVGKMRGGRIKKAMGGPIGATPTGLPGQAAAVAPAAGAPAQANPMSHATITMPVPDAATAARGMLQTGKAVGARQAVGALANAARMRQMRPQGMPGAAQANAAAPRPMVQPGVPGMKKGGHLTAADRHALPAKDFAMPGERYPIPDASHGRNALARVSQHGSPEEKSRVRAAVHRKFPGIGKD